MPNKPAAKKSLRQSKKNAVANRLRKDAFREAIKSAIKATSYEAAVQFVRVAQKALDKAAKEGTIAKNTASRKLSRLMKKIKSKQK